MMGLFSTVPGLTWLYPSVPGSALVCHDLPHHRLPHRSAILINAHCSDLACYTFITDGPGGDFDRDIMNGPGRPIKFLEDPGALDVKVGGPGGPLLDVLGGPGGPMEEFGGPGGPTRNNFWG